MITEQGRGNLRLHLTGYTTQRLISTQLVLPTRQNCGVLVLASVAAVLVVAVAVPVDKLLWYGQQDGQIINGKIMNKSTGQLLSRLKSLESHVVSEQISL